MSDTKLNGYTLDIAAENITALRTLFPDVCTEDKVDFEKFRQLLGEYVDEKKELYNFTWNGKGRALKLSQTPSRGTLLPCKEESKDWDSTENIYIEGDNLEVLKLLQKSYHHAVKMIYIDPPYNTGHDFVYPDDFSDSLKNYKQITRQVDAEGKNISTNLETDGRYHTNWLNMMYPRLRLARNLLRDDGVIFISIDDHEVANLRKVCDEVFGEQNFVAQIIHKNNSLKNQSKFIGVSTEYVIVFAKNMEQLKKLHGEWRVKKKGAEDVRLMYHHLKDSGLTIDVIRSEILEMYSRPKYAHLSRWNKVDEVGVFTDKDLSRDNGPKDFTIINPFTNKDCLIPSRGWAKNKEDLLLLQNQNLIWYGDDKAPPREISYITDETESVLDNFFFADTSIDKKMLDLMFGYKVFDFPKSLDLLSTLIQLCTCEDDLILDFFSGLSTTAHSTIRLNSDDKKNRKFIMVQLPERLDDTEKRKKDNAEAIAFCDSIKVLRTISELGKERIRRAGDKIKNDLADRSSALDLDIGFKVFKLDTSNIVEWNPAEDIEGTLVRYTDNYLYGRTEWDVVYELLLKEGYTLTEEIGEKILAGKHIYSIQNGKLLICLDDHITTELAREIAKEKPDGEWRVIFKDNGFASDSDKINTREILKVAGLREEGFRTL